MKPRVYIEATIPCLLTAWTSKDLIRAAQQRATIEWWARRGEFELFISQLVIGECSEGDPVAAAERLRVLAGLPILDNAGAAPALAAALLAQVPLPPRAAADALHIATASVHGVGWLLSWNCAGASTDLGSASNVG
ncbi:MAG: type II toxin-antitoxin system VapC family toxin [Gemmataceae bacterium]|nr:type II toxin-antitoxin system VapC family toxin [Gemmataceae bacterium]